MDMRPFLLTLLDVIIIARLAGGSRSHCLTVFACGVKLLDALKGFSSYVISDKTQCSLGLFFICQRWTRMGAVPVDRRAEKVDKVGEFILCDDTGVSTFGPVDFHLFGHRCSSPARELGSTVVCVTLAWSEPWGETTCQ